MLILTRRIGEKIQIGDSISITVIAQRGSQIQLGIAAPREIGVLREELLLQDTAHRESVPAHPAADPEKPS